MLVDIGATLYVTMVTCHHHFFKVEFAIFQAILSFTILQYQFVIRYDTRCYFNVRSKADISQLNLPHGTDN